MLFKLEHIKMIEMGMKNATRRIWKKPHVKAGGVYPVQVRMFQPKADCSFIKVNAVYQQRLGDMTEADAKKEGGYTLEEFKKDFETVTKSTWDDDLIVWVVEFKMEKEGEVKHGEMQKM